MYGSSLRTLPQKIAQIMNTPSKGIAQIMNTPSTCLH